VVSTQSTTRYGEVIFFFFFFFDCRIWYFNLLLWVVWTLENHWKTETLTHPNLGPLEPLGV
jgi:hypothetical protein